MSQSPIETDPGDRSGEGAVVGRAAPELSLPDANGAVHRLADYRGRIVVVYFYPKANTAGCTAESCAFRDEYSVLKDLGAEVIGVSSDDAPALKTFAAANRLGFILLSDRDGAARRAWGVPRDLWLLPGRVTYVIDQEGVVRLIFRSAIRMRKHVEEASRMVRELAQAAKSGARGDDP